MDKHPLRTYTEQIQETPVLTGYNIISEINPRTMAKDDFEEEEWVT